MFIGKKKSSRTRSHRFANRLILEFLESRVVPSTVTQAIIQGPVGALPNQLRAVYGMGLVKTTTGQVADGTGQTIAIVDKGYDPTILNDLAYFSSYSGLSAPQLSVFGVNFNGSTPVPVTPSVANLGEATTETTLDVEWAHAFAPGAKIDLVEYGPDTPSWQVAAYAATLPGVSVVSMSLGTTEFAGESANDVFFQQPSGHNPVVFVGSSGDNGDVGSSGEPGTNYPSSSPDVIAVGASAVYGGANGFYQGEQAWNGSTGGMSLYETDANQYAFQSQIVSSVGLSTAGRNIPDVALEGDPETGVALYSQSLFGGWDTNADGGTSLATPSFAAMISIADQIYQSSGQSSTLSTAQVHQALYSLKNTNSQDFHAISLVRENPYKGDPRPSSFSPVFNNYTGLGSPVPYVLLPDLAGVPTVFHYALPSSASPVSLTLRLSAGELQILSQGHILARKSLATTSSIDIHSGTGAINNVNLTINLASFGGNFRIPVLFNPGGANNSLQMVDGNPESWVLTGPDSGWVDGLILFNHVENIQCGTGGSNIVFSTPQAAPVPFTDKDKQITPAAAQQFIPKIQGNLVNGGGAATLNYSLLTTTASTPLVLQQDYSTFATGIFVDLATGQATGIGGLISNIHHVVGTSLGNDVIIGDSSVDLIQGGNGASILVAGNGASQIIAGNGGSILIGGTTIYDHSNTTSPWQALLQEWTAPGASYAMRIAGIRTGVSFNGTQYRLAMNSTVFPANPSRRPGPATGSGAAIRPRLSGGSGQDWFFTSLLSTIINPLFGAGRQVN